MDERELNNILDECLDRLLVKGETIEQCLASYPGRAGELAPLLQTAVMVSEVTTIQPRADFRARARYQMHTELQTMGRKPKRSLFGWMPRWATVLAIVLAVMLAGSGTVAAASQGSMPDEPLYQVKLATEQVRLVLATSDLDKAALCTRFADERVAEIIYLADKGEAERIEQTARRLNNCLTMITQLATGSEEGALLLQQGDITADTNNRHARSWVQIRDTMSANAVDYPARLRLALSTAPESVKPALRAVIDELESGYGQAAEVSN